MRKLAEGTHLNLGDVEFGKAGGDLAGDLHVGMSGAVRHRPAIGVRDDRRHDEHQQHVDLRQTIALNEAAQEYRQHHRRDAQDQRAVVHGIAVEQGEPGALQHLHVPISLVPHTNSIGQLADGQQ